MTKLRVRRKTKSRQWVERLFLLAGLAGVGVWVWSVASGAIYQDWESWVFDNALRGQAATITGYLSQKQDQITGHVRHWLGTSETEAPRVVGQREGPKTQEPRVLPKNGLIGRLVIPRLHLSAMVREGAGEDTLRLALGHIPGTALPGQSGNVGIAGHRDTLFRGLRVIRENDLIRLETLNGDYSYRVEETKIVSPKEVSVLKAGFYPELTLVTCFPFYYVGSAPDRFVVKARQESGNSQPPKPSETLTEVAQQAVPRSVDAPQHQSTPMLKKVRFEVVKSHSRQLVPGISIGLTDTDTADRSVDGWMWVMPDRRTIWLRELGTRDPLIFYGHRDGKKRELVISSVTNNSMTGYLILQ